MNEQQQEVIDNAIKAAQLAATMKLGAQRRKKRRDLPSLGLPRRKVRRAK